jgi:hypothetical protein
MIYKVGDKVFIKSFQQIKNTPGIKEKNGGFYSKDGNCFDNSMKLYCNEKATIESIGKDQDNKVYYKLKNFPWYWSEWMLVSPVMMMIEDLNL